MALRGTFFKHTLDFKFDAGTSRGVLKTKDTWIVKIHTIENPSIVGYGECGPLKGLSIDDYKDFEEKLKDFCFQLKFFEVPASAEEILSIVKGLIPDEFPSIRFGFETAMLDLMHGGKRMIFDNTFYAAQSSIPINGLIWMGNKDFMIRQIEEKIEQGFNCLKMKIGALDFETEVSVLEYIRKQFSKEEMVLRVDANGAFTEKDALNKLNFLAAFDLHSIEQPVMPGQYGLMARLCEQSPVPVALDEELIGIFQKGQKKALLEKIRPPYIILKPTLVGGFQSCQEWIELAASMGIGWWITSALESNIGLNAICQFTANYQVEMPQGLGTGKLYHNNFESPLEIYQGEIRYQKEKNWRIEP
jgi:o-succinylbenzoate synthase